MARRGILLLLIVVAILSACSPIKPEKANNDRVPIPLPEDVVSMAVLNRDGGVLREHREGVVLQRLLQGI